MYFVDRSAVVVKPTEAFLTWLKSTGDDLPDLTLAQIRSNCSVYLLAQADTPEESAGLFGERWREVFSGEIASWEVPQEQWPELTPELFTQFFDLEFHDMVLDTDDDDIRVSPVVDNMM